MAQWLEPVTKSQSFSKKGHAAQSTSKSTFLVRSSNPLSCVSNEISQTLPDEPFDDGKAETGKVLIFRGFIVRAEVAAKLFADCRHIFE